MVQLTGQAGVINAYAGQPTPLNLGGMGEVITGDMMGYLYEQTMRGNMYSWSTAIAGIAPVAPTATFNQPSIINPAGSGRLLVISKISYNRTAVGASPPTEGGIVYAFHRAGAVVGTLADVVSFTQINGQNCRLDMARSGDNSKMLFGTTITVVGVSTFLVNAGISQAASDGTTTGVATFTTIDYVNGSIVVPEGFIFSVCGNATLVTTYAITIYGASIPKPTYFQ